MESKIFNDSWIIKNCKMLIMRSNYVQTINKQRVIFLKSVVENNKLTVGYKLRD